MMILANHKNKVIKTLVLHVSSSFQFLCEIFKTVGLSSLGLSQLEILQLLKHFRLKTTISVVYFTVLFTICIIYIYMQCPYYTTCTLLAGGRERLLCFKYNYNLFIMHPMQFFSLWDKDLTGTHSLDPDFLSGLQPTLLIPVRDPRPPRGHRRSQGMCPCYSPSKVCYVLVTGSPELIHLLPCPSQIPRLSQGKR